MATIYISPTGNDTTGDGTSGNPYATISKAHTESASGDTIYCLDGTYTWVDQTFSKTLTITGSAASSVIFDAGSNNASANWSTSPTISIENITFQNNGTTTYSDGLFGGSSTSILGVFSFTNCIFTDLYTNSDNANWGSAIFSNVTSINSNNIIGAGYTFTSCEFYNLDSNSAGGVVFGFGTNPGGVSPQSYFTLINCSLYLDTSAGVGLSYLVRLGQVEQTMTITNCAFKDANSLTFSTGNGTVTATYSVLNGYTSPPTGTGVVITDPLFIDGPNGDFRLSQNSPAIDAGTVI